MRVLLVFLLDHRSSGELWLHRCIFSEERKNQSTDFFKMAPICMHQHRHSLALADLIITVIIYINHMMGYIGSQQLCKIRSLKIFTRWTSGDLLLFQNQSDRSQHHLSNDVSEMGEVTLFSFQIIHQVMEADSKRELGSPKEILKAIRMALLWWS